ncbi:hypothetical protein M3182_11145 [Mesobacillus maritimus]|uniref:hypothetical protein n=1 Tax=Mesobacillus maritimus TaxID=1643336 RepID=UPI00203D3142|nr:hypothetical protein [Mesobacillus maritimus]MCM3586287.1 hypothetical protein [Mesobacillus maritimus]MCM3671683.1 hypothetical protein [Mesobacillus maritimus]
MEFLFENPLLIFIIMGILSSLFRKGKEEQKQEPKRPSRPVQQQRSDGRASQSESMEPTMAQTIEHEEPRMDPKQMVPENPFLDIQKKYEERRKELEQIASERTHSSVNRPTAPTRAVDPKTDGETSLDLTPSPDRVIEGIAWSQVLGPPRARNPYHRDRRR